MEGVSAFWVSKMSAFPSCYGDLLLSSFLLVESSID